MKKLIAVFLSLLFCISFPINAVAIDNSAHETYIDNSLEIITPDTFSALLASSDCTQTNYLSNESLDVPYISYEYTLSPETDSSLSANVTFYFSIINGTSAYTTVLNGTIEGYLLSDGSLLWHGPINGNITINDSPYLVTLGFSKLDHSSDVQADVTLQASNANTSVNHVAFSFGQSVLKLDSVDYLPVIDENAISIGESTLVTINSSGENYQQFASATASQVNGSSSVLTQDVRYLYEPNMNKLAICLNSFTDNIASLYSDIYINPVSSVSGFSVRLQRGEYTAQNYSWIAGPENPGLDSNSNGSILLRAVFEDLMSIIGIPTSTILAIWDGVQGTVNVTNYTNDCTIDVSINGFTDTNFDDCLPGVPVVYQLHNAASTYPQLAWYTATSTIEYWTLGLIPQCNLPHLFYSSSVATKDLGIIMPLGV